jgi:hypothetical protein
MLRLWNARASVSVRAVAVAVAATLAAAWTPARAQAAWPGQFVVDAGSGCKIWNPHPEPGEAVVWTGPCRNGLAHGPGRLQWLRDGKAYEVDQGEWADGRQQGHGSQDWASGRYEGDLLGGEPQGRGILTLRTTRYEGAFEGGKPNGTGTMTGPGGTFTGTWKNGCLVGDSRGIAIGVPSSGCR